jgi:hypothetical protein
MLAAAAGLEVEPAADPVVVPVVPRPPGFLTVPWQLKVPLTTPALTMSVQISSGPVVWRLKPPRTSVREVSVALKEKFMLEIY